MTARFGIVTAEFGNVTDRIDDVIDDERDFAKPEFDIDLFKLDSPVAMGVCRIASGDQRHGIGRSRTGRP